MARREPMVRALDDGVETSLHDNIRGQRARFLESNSSIPERPGHEVALGAQPDPEEAERLDDEHRDHE